MDVRAALGVYNAGVRRFSEILLTAVTAISFLLAIATGILWIQSGRVQDELIYYMIDSPNRSTTFCRIRSSRGLLSVSTSNMYYASREQIRFIDPTQPSYNPGSDMPTWGWSRNASAGTPYHPQGSFWNQRGFRFTFPRWIPSPTPGRWRVGSFWMPHWFLLLICLILPGLSFRRRLRRLHRARLNLCARCGYDLRASPERCPECGAVAKKGRA